MRSRRLVATILAGLALASTGCSSGHRSASGNASLTFVGYSTIKEVNGELISAFQRTESGLGVRFTQSYGASGDQSRAVASGLAADVVVFSLEPDMARLVKAGKVAADWNQDQYHGMVSNSVMAFVVRKGNPKAIRTWDDLVKPGVDVLTPNPFTSGGARWNVMAAYGAQIEQGRSPAQAAEYLRTLFRHVSVQDKSAREAMQTFVGGKGDVLLAYENEAITAQAKHQPVDYVVPEQTILIENPVAVTSGSRQPDKARAFVDFLRSPDGQRIYAKDGYRPVLASAADPARYPVPRGLFTIQALGGWKDVSDRFFDPESGLMATIEHEIGVSVAAR
jgi:sulfate/thiosulfate transport system substrate-binding protein